MTLKNQLEEQLALVKEKAQTAKSAYKYCFEFIKSFFTKELIDDHLNRIFALKKIELENTFNRLDKLLKYLIVFEKHKEMILYKDITTSNAVNLLDELKDELNNIIAEVQGLTIFLEERLKQQ